MSATLETLYQSVDILLLPPTPSTFVFPPPTPAQRVTLALSSHPLDWDQTQRKASTLNSQASNPTAQLLLNCLDRPLHSSTGAVSSSTLRLPLCATTHASSRCIHFLLAVVLAQHCAPWSCSLPSHCSFPTLERLPCSSEFLAALVCRRAGLPSPIYVGDRPLAFSSSIIIIHSFIRIVVRSHHKVDVDRYWC